MKNFLWVGFLCLPCCVTSFTAIDLCCVLSAVAKMKSGDHLSEDFPDELLLDVIVSLCAALDNLLEISTLAVFHYYVNLEFLLHNIPLIVPDNARVLQLTQDVDLRDNLLLLLLIHLAIVELLPDQDSAIALPSNLAHFSKTTCDRHKQKQWVR